VPLGSNTSWSWVFSAYATAVPGTFWLFSASIFDDQFRLRPWHVGLVLATVLPPVLGRYLPESAVSVFLLYTLPQALEFVLLGLTLWVVSKHWQVDLVESRRSLRIWFVGINGAYIFALVFSRAVLFSGEGWLSSWQYLPVGGVLLLMNALLLRYKGEVFVIGMPALEPGSVATPLAEVPVEEAETDHTLAASLRSMMEAEHIYREMGLTIGQLAQKLEVPQYRLRRTINVGLGYRNFSDFLNHYRIAETSARLADPAESSLPVLTIAMDAGFRSLSSFNKAFKEKRGQTPTDYRKTVVQA